MSDKRLRVAVVGVGRAGALHAKLYHQLPRAELVAVCDTDRSRAEAVAAELHTTALTDYRRLRGLAEAVSIAVPAGRHYAVGSDCLRHGLHVLMEKPLATHLPQADRLVALARRRKLMLQVGHVERFNPAWQAVVSRHGRVRYLEAARISPYPYRGTDVSVVLDVMIHDLDLVLALVPGAVRRIQAVGIPVLSKLPDLANVRLEFANGAVANLTASRVSDESVRKFRVFQEDAYFSLDFVAQTAEMARRDGHAIHRAKLAITRHQPLQEELSHFVDAVLHRRRPLVTGREARAALALALRIEAQLRRRYG
ncbi:MAG: Gfo/Idh/MocA family oxidoreductase [Candidatus Omnitrophica bacterium]|nr:Gfo/Idh/MocA family oxidoreductase [Candidatus Omnitrophota bacterium]